jgi:hypothetical protein
MTRYEKTVFCDNCGVEITWSPVYRSGGEYCCRDCSERRPCRCGERMEWDDDRRTRETEDPGMGAAADHAQY